MVDHSVEWHSLAQVPPGCSVWVGAALDEAGSRTHPTRCVFGSGVLGFGCCGASMWCILLTKGVGFDEFVCHNVRAPCGVL